MRDELRVAKALDELEAKVREETSHNPSPFHVYPNCTKEEIDAEAAGATSREISDAYARGLKRRKE